MSRVRRYGIFRDVAWLLIVALTVTLVGIFPATAGEAPAGGAEEVGIARERIAILDFTVARGVPRWMGRASADALAYAIVASEEPLWDVVPRQQVEDAIIDLKIPRKLSVADIQRLGAHLGAHYVAIGHVASAKVTRKPRTGYVQLQIKIYEVATGEVVNGAHVAERSPEGVDETKLLADALNRAAARAVQDMAATRLPRGQVLTRLPDNRLLLNIGAKDGVSANMRMSVIHTDLKTGETRKIGEITIKAVEQRQSYATIDWEIQGIQQMDKVRALFTLPALGEAGRRPIVRKRRTVTSWLQGLIFPLIGLALLFGVIGQSRKAEKAPEVLSAQSLSSGEGIVVRFGKGGGTVLGVEIYRGDTPGFSPSTATRIDIVPGNVNSYWDTTLYFEGDASVEEVDDPQETPFLEREVEANRARLKRLRKQVSRMKSRQVVVSEYEAEFIHTPLQLGVQQYYIIRRITARRPAVSIISAVGGTTGGGGTQQIAWEIVLSSYSAPIGPATAFRKMTDADLLLPPNIGQVGSDTVNLADVTFRWLSVRGADEYALFVSTDRNNLVPGKAYMKTVTFTQDRDGVPIEVRLVNELNRYFNVYQPTTFYWRVGYRNTRDMALPYPDGWVWSVVHSFKTAPSPPTPPRERTRK